MNRQRHILAFVVMVALSSLPAFVSAEMHYSPDPDSCEIIGNPDLYGIGVRVGFYLNWAAMCFAIMLVPDHAIPTYISIQGLDLSISICFFANVLQRGVSKAFLPLECEIMEAETLLLGQSLLYPAFWIFGSLERFRPIACLITFTYSIIFFALAFRTAIGQVSEQRAACPLLSDHINKSTQIFMAVTSALAGLMSLAYCLWNLWETFRYNRPSRSQAWRHEPHHSLWQRLGGWESRINPQKATAIFSGVLIGTLSIVRLEVTLKRYKISTADASFTSASQLSPFLLGLFNLLYVFWRSYERGVAAWPLIYWCHEIRMWLDYLMHPSKTYPHSLCAERNFLVGRC